MWPTIRELIKNFALVFLFAGFVVLMLGLSGGAEFGQYKIPIIGNFQYVAIALGVLIIGGSFYAAWKTKASQTAELIKIDPKDYGVRITAPTVKKGADSIIIEQNRSDIKGVIKKDLPKGYVLCLFRMYDNNAFVPVSGIGLHINSNKSWEVAQCDVLGNASRRPLALYLVGPSGQALLEYYRAAVDKHEETRKQVMAAGSKPEYLPSILRRTEDMIECVRINFERKQSQPTNSVGLHQ